MLTDVEGHPNVHCDEEEWVQVQEEFYRYVKYA